MGDNTITRTEVLLAKMQGMDARVNNIPYRKCPYSDSKQVRAWRKGWREQNKVYLKRVVEKP